MSDRQLEAILERIDRIAVELQRFNRRQEPCDAETCPLAVLAQLVPAPFRAVWPIWATQS